MKKNLFLSSICLLFVCSVSSQPIPINPLFYGQNYWFTNFNQSNPPIADLTNWPELQATGAKLIRVGGHNYNFDLFVPSNRTYPLTSGGVLYPQGYVTIVDNIRSKGCEPMITVPFNGNLTPAILATEAANAAEIVRVLNVVHKRNVKYFIIANEPGKDYLWYDYTATALDAVPISQYVKAFAIEMRKVDPEIKIIGPELEGNYPNIVNVLLSSSDPSSLVGLIPSISSTGEPTGAAEGKPWIDYFSHHFYAGYDPVYQATNRAQQIESGYFYSDASFTVADQIALVSSTMKLVVDEVNMKLN